MTTWLIILDIALALLGLALLLRLSVVGRALGSFGEWTANARAFTVGQVVCWVAFFLLLSAPMVLFGHVLGFLLWLTTIVIALMIAHRYREAEWRMLYWSLGVAAERGIPLNAAAHAFADERGDSVGRRARELALALENGMSLDDALLTAGASLPTEALLAVRTGLYEGHLATSLKGVGRPADAADNSARATMSQFTYLAGIICVATFIIVFIMCKIVPEYIKIFDGFHMRLPDITIAVIAFAESLASPLLVEFFGILFALLLFLIARYIGLITWDPPIVRRFTRPLDEAIVLRSLSRSVEQQQALPMAVAALATHYPKSYIRKRLLRALLRIEDGANWCDGLQAAGLLRPAAANVLKSAERVDNLSWALDEMADRQVRRFVVRLATVRSIAFPAAIFLIAFVVASIAAGMLAPLAYLIQGLV
ncbi:MAG TPA: type II secretion system F family protein [Pirellulales bacterium]